MDHSLVLKLECAGALSATDRQALVEATRRVRSVAARTVVIAEGDKPDQVHVVMSGYLCRAKTVPDGGRQIVAWLIPGDPCDVHVWILGAMDHDLVALSDCEIACVPREVMERLTVERPAIARAFWWSTLVDEGVLREWLVGMGRRPADQRIAHLFCELLLRHQAVGRGLDGVLDLPVTQAELADTVGVSTVHVNRVLQQLREERLIELDGRRLILGDPERLMRFADFDPAYLHLPARA